MKHYLEVIGQCGGENLNFLGKAHANPVGAGLGTLGGYTLFHGNKQ